MRVAATRHPQREGPARERRADFVDALAKGLQLLGAFEHDPILSNRELVEITGLPKATVSRLCGTLVAMGFLQRDESSRRYIVGSRVLGFGASLQRQQRLQRSARRQMQRFAGEYGLSVALGTRERTRILLLDAVHPPQGRPTAAIDAGLYLPLASSSLGLACLVASPVGERVQLIAGMQRNLGGSRHDVRARVERAHAERERQRFVVSLPSDEGRLARVAVPLVVERRRVFAFAAAAPASELTLLRLMDVVGPALADMVARIACELGGCAASAESAARVRRGTPE